jgi:uncharacterized protein (TIGR00290 family)
LNKIKTYFNWSTGKDSALALYHLLQDKSYSVEHLLTSVNAIHDRVSMHGLRRELLAQQIDSLGIPAGTIELPEEPSMKEYEAKMIAALSALKEKGFECAAFGDIFLEDLKKYREDQLSKMKIRTVFPLWKKDTGALLHEFIELGFKAIVVCVNSNLLDPSFAGRLIDESFIRDLPRGVDPCGENGEFHTFCFDGPIFKYSIPFLVGEKTFREYKASSQEGNIGFWFCDLLPGR